LRFGENHISSGYNDKDVLVMPAQRIGMQGRVPLRSEGEGFFS
jgi:hypothetical protein